MPQENPSEFPAGNLPSKIMASLASALFGLPITLLIWLPGVAGSPSPLVETLLGVSSVAGFLFLLVLTLVFVVVGSTAWQYCLRGFLYSLLLVSFSLAVVPRIT